MPFTPVHALVALPLAARPWARVSTSTRTWALSALAVGAMAPDLPLFLDVLWPGAEDGAVHTHRWQFLPVVLVLALAVTALWVRRVRSPFLAALPRRGASQSTPTAASRRGVGPGGLDSPDHPDRPGRWTPVGGLLVVGMALLGILSHLLWDDVTHLRGAAVQAWPLLREPMLGRPVYVYLQHGSSLLGVLALSAAALVWFRRAVPVPAPRHLRSLLVATMAGAAVGLVAAAARLVHDDAGVSVYALARLAATFPVLGSAIAVTVWALVVGAPVQAVSMERSGSGAPI